MVDGACPCVPRRRPTFPAYAARRWRVLGLLGVLLLGSLLVLAITDRGHEPRWVARTGAIDSAAVSPDGQAVYALIREEGNVTRLEARRGATGALLWESPLRAPRALLAAGDGGVALATDFPFAFLTVFGVDGSIRSVVPLEGNPRALRVEDDRVAIALQAPGNPVLVFEGGVLLRTHGFDSFVKAIDLRAGRLAAGTGDGHVALFEANGTALLDASLGMSVRSLALSRDGGALLVGGYGLATGDLSGSVAFLDATERPPLRWQRPASAGVGLVGLDDGALWAMAVEESPPRYRLRMMEAATGQTRWTRDVDGYVARDDAGSEGGASLSPDGRAVAVATLRGDLEVLSVAEGAGRWSFRAEGATQASFARDRPDLLLATGRLVPTGAYSQAMLFSVSAEPVSGRLPVLTLLLSAAAAGAGAAILGVGYWRVRRAY